MKARLITLLVAATGVVGVSSCVPDDGSGGTTTTTSPTTIPAFSAIAAGESPPYAADDPDACAVLPQQAATAISAILNPAEPVIRADVSTDHGWLVCAFQSETSTRPPFALEVGASTVDSIIGGLAASASAANASQTVAEVAIDGSTTPPKKVCLVTTAAIRPCRYVLDLGSGLAGIVGFGGNEGVLDPVAERQALSRLTAELRNSLRP
jgi:hypothetical protein